MSVLFKSQLLCQIELKGHVVAGHQVVSIAPAPQSPFTTVSTIILVGEYGRGVRSTPAVVTVTLVFGVSHHIPFYRARPVRQARQAEQALPGVPAYRSPSRLLVQKDQRENPRLRAVG